MQVVERWKKAGQRERAALFESGRQMIRYSFRVFKDVSVTIDNCF